MKIFFYTTILSSFALLAGAPSSFSASDPIVPEEDESIEEWLRGDDLKALEIDDIDDLLDPIPLWDVDTTLNTGVGHRDNVMLSAFEPEEGTFFLAGFETMVLRVPKEGPQLTFFLDAEHLEFFSDSDLPNDTFLSGYSRLTVPVPQDFTVSFGLLGFYLDQMIDVATSDTPVEPIQVRGHGITVDSKVRKDWVTDFFAESSVSASRQEYRDPLHDYWEYGPQLSTGWSPADSEISFSIEFLERAYDDRRAFSAEGDPIAESDVRFRILRPQMDLRHAWGEGWHSHSQLRLEFNRDDDSDYFAYDRVRVTQQLGYRVENWEIQGRVRYSFFDYAVQQVPGTEETRRRHSWGFGLEARRQLTDSLDLFGRYDREEVHSNEPETDYDVNTWTVGLGWKF